MTRPRTMRQFPNTIIRSSLLTTMVSIAAVWLLNSAVAPVAVTPDAAKRDHAETYKPSGRLFRLSPIPPGADWTS
jgi:hypothetical protein